jgi:hypothetical protein
MKKIVFGTITKDNGRLIVRDASTKKNITKLFRTSIIDIAFDNGQALKFDKDTGRASGNI